MLLSLGELVASPGATIQGGTSLIAKSIALLNQTGADQLASLSSPLYLNQAVGSGADAIIVPLRDLETLKSQGHAAGRNWLTTASSYVAFAHAVQRSVALTTHPVVPGIHPSVSVEEGAKVPASYSIGPNVIIRAGAVLGKCVRIAGNSSVGAGAHTGDDTLLHANISTHYGCEVGMRCILHSGVVIGADGFGFTPDFGPQGDEWVKIPQVGRAVIGDDIGIGTNAAIDRGTMADMVVEQGCKIGNRMRIAHNVHVGIYTVIAGCAAIPGSTKIGRYCIVGDAANFAGRLTIVDRVTVSGGTSVIKSIIKSGDHFTSVFPFMPHGDWERGATIARGLTRTCERL